MCIRDRVGYVTQAHNVAWDFPIDVYDATLNATLGQRPWWQRAGEREHRATERALEMVNLTDLAARPIHDLSGGQRQRVLIARALVRRPGMLLLDEPFTGLDDASSGALLGRLRTLRESGAIVILATHDLDLAEGLLDHALFLREGRIVESVVTPGGLRSTYRSVIGR